MTKKAIRKASEKLDTVEQADVLSQLAVVLYRSLSDMDQMDSRVFDARCSEEPRAKPKEKVLCDK